MNFKISKELSDKKIRISSICFKRLLTFKFAIFKPFKFDILRSGGIEVEVVETDSLSKYVVSLQLLHYPRKGLNLSLQKLFKFHNAVRLL